MNRAAHGWTIYLLCPKDSEQNKFLLMWKTGETLCDNNPVIILFNPQTSNIYHGFAVVTLTMVFIVAEMWEYSYHIFIILFM